MSKAIANWPKVHFEGKCIDKRVGGRGGRHGKMMDMMGPGDKVMIDMGGTKVMIRMGAMKVAPAVAATIGAMTLF